jgi:prephenate dehydrogenase
VGARPARLTPATHDRVVAYLSHVPQLVSWAIAGAARRDPVARRHLALAGPGFASMTRLARSPRGLWRQVLAQNAGEVARARRALLRELGRAAGRG